MARWLKHIFLAAGLCLMLYPATARLWTQYCQSRVIQTFEAAEQTEDGAQTDSVIQAEQYNMRLFRSEIQAVDSEQELSSEQYESYLNESNTGTMAVLSIPAISLKLPVYHGTSDEVLASGCGHLEGTSLPVGGNSTHCVLTGHRGLPSSELFTRLDEVRRGELLFLNTAGQLLTYRVMRIQVMTPEDAADYAGVIQTDRDLVSLITCTPYGINTHRLVVTGERTMNPQFDLSTITSKKPSIRERLLAGIPYFILAAAAVSMLRLIRKKRRAYENRKMAADNSVPHNDGSNAGTGGNGK